MKLNLDYKVSDTYREKSKLKNNQELTANFITFAVNSKYKDGLKTGSQRRLFGRLQRAMDDAIETDKDSIELEQAQIDFLHDVFRGDIPVYPYEAQYFIVLEEEIEKLVTSKKEENLPEEENDLSEDSVL